MNKAEFVEAIAEKAEVSKKEANDVLTAVIDTITEELKAGNSVTFVGFGKFETRLRAARKGHNPSTGEAINIPACKAPVFKAGRALKDLINNK